MSEQRRSESLDLLKAESVEAPVGTVRVQLSPITIFRMIPHQKCNPNQSRIKMESETG